MDREIKFRAKYFDKWYFGNLVTRKAFDEQGNEHNVYILMGDSIKDDMWLPIREEQYNTVGQFTGLHDKNCTEIYEGDIVECVSWNEYFSKDGQPMEAFRRKMYIDFRNGGFKMIEPMPTPLEDHVWDIIYNGDIEVIGNIHDNPELLMRAIEEVELSLVKK